MTTNDQPAAGSVCKNCGMTNDYSVKVQPHCWKCGVLRNRDQPSIPRSTPGKDESAEEKQRVWYDDQDGPFCRLNPSGLAYHADAAYLNALESQVAALKRELFITRDGLQEAINDVDRLETALDAAEKKAALLASVMGWLTSLRDDPWEVEDEVRATARKFMLEYAAVLNPVLSHPPTVGEEARE